MLVQALPLTRPLPLVPTVIVAAFLASKPALSQQPSSVPERPCTFDTAALVTIQPVVIGLAARPPASSRQPAPDDYLLAAQAIGSHYLAPRSVSLPFWAQVLGDDTTGANTSDVLGHGLDSELWFRLTVTGHLADSTVHILTASPEFNASLVAAVRAADTAGAFVPPSDLVRRDRGTIGLRLINWTKRTGDGVGLVRLEVPVIHADSRVQFASSPPVRYPDVARARGIESSVTLQYVVTELGRADPTTLRLLEAEYEEFALEAKKMVARAKFTPAHVRGCPVPALVTQKVNFRICFVHC